jgi:hypothetical protein
MKRRLALSLAALLLLGCLTPALAAEEIADREHGEKWIREIIEREMKGETDNQPGRVPGVH